METNQLLAMLTDPDQDTRDEALEELALLMDDQIAQALLDVAGSDASDEVRSDAIAALGPVIEECGDEYFEGADFDFGPELGPPVSRETFALIVPTLRALYDDDAQPTLVRRRTFEVLVRDPQKWLSKEIRKHFASKDPDWRLTAVFAMGFIAGFEQMIAETVSTAEGQLLFEAVIAAGRMSVSAAASRIHTLATSKEADLDLRLAAIEALRHVDSDCSDTLEELTGSSKPEIAEAAEAALEDLEMFGDLEDDELEDEDD
jgi:hypothetical protein